MDLYYEMEPTTSSAEKRPYCQPELMEWGSLVDLTRGPLMGPPDDVIDGTSNPEL